MYETGESTNYFKSYYDLNIEIICMYKYLLSILFFSDVGIIHWAAIFTQKFSSPVDWDKKFPWIGHGQPAEVGTSSGKRSCLTKCFCFEILQKTGQIESSPGYWKKKKNKDTCFQANYSP